MPRAYLRLQAHLLRGGEEKSNAWDQFRGSQDLQSQRGRKILSEEQEDQREVLPAIPKSREWGLVLFAFSANRSKDLMFYVILLKIREGIIVSELNQRHMSVSRKQTDLQLKVSPPSRTIFYHCPWRSREVDRRDRTCSRGCLLRWRSGWSCGFHHFGWGSPERWEGWRFWGKFLRSWML